MGPLEAAKAFVPARFAEPPRADHPAVRYGLALHDAGFYWEAHEVLEAVWKASPLNSRERRLVRAVIQLANAGLKLRMGRPRAALRLLGEARDLLREGAGGEGAGALAAAGACSALADEVETQAKRLSSGETAEIPTLARHLRS